MADPKIGAGSQFPNRHSRSFIRADRCVQRSPVGFYPGWPDKSGEHRGSWETGLARSCLAGDGRLLEMPRARRKQDSAEQPQ